MGINFVDYLDPAMLAIVAACYAIGLWLKSTPKIAHWMIPYILTGISMIIYVVIEVYTGDKPLGLSIVDGLVEGVICAAVAVYSNQLYKQVKNK